MLRPGFYFLIFFVGNLLYAQGDLPAGFTTLDAGSEEFAPQWATDNQLELDVLKAELKSAAERQSACRKSEECAPEHFQAKTCHNNEDYIAVSIVANKNNEIASTRQSAYLLYDYVLFASRMHNYRRRVEPNYQMLGIPLKCALFRQIIPVCIENKCVLK